MGINSDQLTKQFLNDVAVHGINKDMLHIYFDSIYQAGYEDGRDNSWWHAQEQKIDLGGC